MPLAPDVLEKIKRDLNDKQITVFEVFAEHDNGDGFTSDEVEARLNATHQSISTRISELAKKDLLEDKGIRRKTRSGGSAIVYTLKRP